MKRLIFTLATVALLSSMAFCLMVSMMVTPRADTASTDAMPAPSENALPTLDAEEAVSYLKQQGLHTSLGEAMAAARYGVHWSKHTPWKDLPGAYYAGNPAQQMTAFFSAEGIHLEAQSASQDEAQSASENKWRMGMRLTGLGYGERLLRVTAGEMKVNGNRVEIERRVESRESGVESQIARGSDSGLRTPDARLVEWYVNRAEGIEQGFMVNAAPGERREGEWLRLRLAVEGDLRARLADDGEAVDLLTRGGARALRYDKLHVYDAAGRELLARMRVEGGEVMLEVEEGEAVYPLTIDPVFSQQQKLTASDGAANDLFGESVAISGETVVVGAVFDDVGANDNQGSAYIFVRNGTVWSEQQKLTASDGTAFDDFGYSVAISGESVMVGAILDDIGANSEQGSAYIFVRNGTVWNEQQKLTAADGGMDDNFGISVGISGESVVVGAVGGNVGKNTEQGSAYVFVRVGTVWSEQQKLTASDGAADDQFGYSVAISGKTVVVGARIKDVGANTDQGSAYIFFLPCMNNMPPVITCPVNLTVIAANPGSTTVVVNYPPPVATDDGGAPSVVCLPPTGSAFPLGTTTVTCTATDSAGNTAQCSFTVTVFDICLQDDSNATTVLLLNSLTGDYRFCCSGSIFAGKGTVQKSGSTFTLTHNTVDRRVTAKLDSALNRGAASLQSPVGTTRCTINDRNTRNNTCACSVGG